MANSASVCSTFKRDLLQGLHAFGPSVVRAGTGADTFKLALYLTSASRGAADTAYTNTDELAGTGGYTQGGQAVTNGTAPALDGTTAHWTPSTYVEWTSFTSSGAFDACLLYNDTSAGKLAVAVFTFGAQIITAGTFRITMPANTGSTGLLRIA